MIKQHLSNFFSFLLILIGLIVLLYPDISEWRMQMISQRNLEIFQGQYQQSEIETKKENDETMEESVSEKQKTEDTAVKKKDKKTDSYYQEILSYNKQIYEENQIGFCDAWNYEQSPISLNGLKEGVFGYIEIPALNRTFPLYIGASMNNLAKGLAVLGQTSIPIGGENTNSVISGHRGWSTGPFLRDIEKVSIGDGIFITNPWEELSYRVESIDIIKPYEVDTLKIQPGKDMISIVTCHPYLSHGKKDRYILYCVRDESLKKADIKKAEEDKEEIQTSKELKEDQSSAAEEEDSKASQTIIDSEGVAHESSSDLIFIENLIRRGIAGITIIFLLFLLVKKKIRK